ncbi:MAG: hypothetical protein O7G83_20110, partial [Proteobacteria bacterium]|nr:hypothetical protein [Pseudomonadota bacterium]
AENLLPNASQETLTRLGKTFSWLIVVLLIGVALLLREKASLVTLMDRKLDLLIQLTPAFMLSLRWQRLHGGAVFAGLVTGIVIALTLAFGDLDFVVRGKVYGFHPGLVALLPNLAIAVIGSLRQKSD